MSWATHYIAKLQQGETVQFRPRGGSMKGRVPSGALCTVEPLQGPPQVNDVVLCRVAGAQYLHLVKATKIVRDDVRYQIGNNLGNINGWIGIGGIYGKLIRIDP
jgi:hypothetical protein